MPADSSGSVYSSRSLTRRSSRSPDQGSPHMHGMHRPRIEYIVIENTDAFCYYIWVPVCWYSLMAEHLIRNEKVVGSTPTISSNRTPSFAEGVSVAADRGSASHYKVLFWLIRRCRKEENLELRRLRSFANSSTKWSPKTRAIFRGTNRRGRRTHNLL